MLNTREFHYYFKRGLASNEKVVVKDEAGNVYPLKITRPPPPKPIPPK